MLVSFNFTNISENMLIGFIRLLVNNGYDVSIKHSDKDNMIVEIDVQDSDVKYSDGRKICSQNKSTVRSCLNCNYTDGVVYTTIPPMRRCKITNQFHLESDICNVDDANIEIFNTKFVNLT